MMNKSTEVCQYLSPGKGNNGHDKLKGILRQAGVQITDGPIGESLAKKMTNGEKTGLPKGVIFGYVEKGKGVGGGGGGGGVGVGGGGVAGTAVGGGVGGGGQTLSQSAYRKPVEGSDSDEESNDSDEENEYSDEKNDDSDEKNDDSDEENDLVNMCEKIRQRDGSPGARDRRADVRQGIRDCSPQEVAPTMFQALKDQYRNGMTNTSQPPQAESLAAPAVPASETSPFDQQRASGRILQSTDEIMRALASSGGALPFATALCSRTTA